MLRMAFLCIVLALVVGAIGFGGSALVAVGSANMLFWLFVALLVLSLSIARADKHTVSP